MITTLRPITLRTRLTVIFALVFGAMLALYAIGAYLLIRDRFASELDLRLEQELEITEQNIVPNSEGRLVWRLTNEFNNNDDEQLQNVAWVDVWHADGQLLLRRQDAATASGQIPIPPFNTMANGLHALEVPDEIHLRLLQRTALVAGEHLTLRAALREDDFARGLTVVLWVMVAVLPVALAIASVVGYWLAGRSLAPIQRMAVEAERINAERLNARLPVVNPHDETGRLAEAFNALLGRLESAFLQLRRFTADASHELRTPLTVIRSVGEVGLRERHSESEYRDIIGTMLEEADRLAQLTAILLELTRAESGKIALKSESFDFCEMASDAAGFIGALAEEVRVRVVLNLSDSPIVMTGDRTVLRQALINLLDNAVKHSPKDAEVTLSCQSMNGQLDIAIQDQGEGIPAEALPYIFDRFYRVDSARSREKGGFGLGLAIARWAVEIHGGRIEIKSELGKGSVFQIVLPGKMTPSQQLRESTSGKNL
ncbi:MAG TPA: HAMP domain-containing histidine kinase [Gammaproteobacteria bacterium]|uniref:HAMP domain-containing histidine kinase n=1 Tax=Gammaproteobacteria TaxID=1236 RepID=UPI00097742D7|nr:MULTISPECIES: HAMP domain-containing histidine kinase [Gammaproteobacteria]HBY00578.1 HAMP domain-containing histidine kinase [Gammaproteobacteria bacterium]|tara:strand:- start:15251 stop:16708 length:1458 start_codon:yes stop_codon:yes gene_type:complete